VVPFYVIFLSVLAVSTSFALWKGGPPERLGAAVLIAMAVVQIAAHQLIPGRFDNVDPAGFTVDLMGFVGMTVIALYADRIWPLWTAALQLLACAAHVVRLLSIEVEPLVYGTMKSGATFVVLFLLMIGTAMHQYRVRRHGADPSWTMSLPPPFWMRSKGQSSRD
jgi:hypothetical protein